MQEELRTFHEGHSEAEMFDISKYVALVSAFWTTKQSHSFSLIRRALAPILEHGLSPYEWAKLRPVVIWTAMQRIEELKTDETDQVASAAKEQIRDALGKFQFMPFTMQRFCEVLENPRRFYKTCEKLAHALEKLLRVSGTLPDMTPEEHTARLEQLKEEKAGSKENGLMMMAIDVDLRPPPVVPMGSLMGGGGGGGGGGSQGGSEQENNVQDEMDISD